MIVAMIRHDLSKMLGATGRLALKPSLRHSIADFGDSFLSLGCGEVLPIKVCAVGARELFGVVDHLSGREGAEE